MRKTRNSQAGFTIMEILIAIAIFLIVSLGIYFSYANILDILNRTQDKTLARSLLDREVESLRSLDYDQVGVQGGYPPGILPASRSLVYQGKQFTIDAYVRNIDDPFDGVTGGSPNDTAPADYKLVELRVSCADCFNFKEMAVTTWVGPENLETASNNGSLFINVFDASGQPVEDADITVVNNALNPTITIYDSTNNEGQLKLIDIPPSVNGYEVSVSKPGYSSAQTYEIGDSANPNPILPHATVATQQITDLSLAIDKVSTVAVRTQDFLCTNIGSATFDMTGDILIGAGPDVPRYTSSFTTDSSGDYLISDLPWDDYNFVNNTNGYDLAGSMPLVPLSVDPDSHQNLFFTLYPSSGNSLLVKVLDGETNDLVSGAASVALTKSGFNDTKLTGEWQISQSDWSGNNYYAQDGNIDSENAPGQITLLPPGGPYPTSTNSWLISKIYDFGTSTTQFNSIDWTSVEPIPAGANSVQFQLASNNDLSTWNYVGPDGTANTFYNVPGSSIGAFHDGDRYLRYKVFLNTINTGVTPTLKDWTIKFSSGCVPSAQAFWPSLSTGTYDITVTKSGYVTATSTVDINSTWQQNIIDLEPSS